MDDVLNPIPAIRAACALAMMFAGNLLAAEATAPQSLVHFKDANFGVRFSHPPAISTSYNPHGEANRVFILFQEEPIGGLAIQPAPAMASIEEFIAGGREHFRRKYSATDVEYAVLENPHGISFHYLKVRATIEGDHWVIERYIHLRPKLAHSENPIPPEAPGQALLESLAGTFSFEFIYRAKDYEHRRSEIRTVIDTFRLGKR